VGADERRTRRVTVEVEPDPYEAVIGPGVLTDLGRRVREALGAGARRAMIVEDPGVPQRIRDRAAESLEREDLDVVRRALAPGERAKSVESWSDLLATMTETRLERAHPVIALGGGIVGDVAGFAAATYRRGVPIVQCPTTLLAMVDASIGGKTGINLTLADGSLVKNMAGAFHHPRLVLADIEALFSLDERTFRSGLAECVKHALISGAFGDPGLLEWLESRSGPILARDADALVELVERNVRVKARVVSADERETADAGGRSLLNLGHTFAHAIEPMEHLSPTGAPSEAPLHHGEAVALGLVASCHAARALGEPSTDELPDRVIALLERLGLPTAVHGLPGSGAIVVRMGYDKKTTGGRLRLIVPAGGSRSRIIDDPPESAIAAGIDAIRAPG